MMQAPQDVQATFCATLVDQWVRMGMRNAVIAPGSRSTPMALALAARDDLALQVAHDERSAAFIALGVSLATRLPAALLCTSGTAATHFHAAVVEADLAGVPLLVLTADRPPELQGIGSAQTIDQRELYGRAARLYADPGVADASASETWRAFASDWWRVATGSNPGPVHINLPFREPLVGVVGELPDLIEGGPVERGEANPELVVRVTELAGLFEQQRGVIIAGGGVDDAAAVGLLAEALQWPVLADPRSGCRQLAQAVSCFDSLLRGAQFANDHRPSVVLHLGEPPASKVLGQWLQASVAVHVHVHSHPRIIDPLRLVTERVCASPAQFCKALATNVAADRDAVWLSAWLQAEGEGQQAIEMALAAELSEPAVARALSAFDGELVVSSSMPVRDVEWFGRPGVATKVHSNRGANGIDGVIATAIGVAVGSSRPTAVLLGDVAFCHDQSSLTALAARRLPLTIVVIDNDGGGIFSFLPQAGTLAPARFEQLFGTPHGTDIVAIATAHGLGARTVSTTDQLAAAIADPTVVVVRVCSNRADNVVVHDRLHAAVAAALTV